MSKGILILLFLLGVVYSFQPNDRQAKLLSNEGHLIILSAENRNISLKTSGGGYVNINEENLIQVANNARRASETVERFQSVVVKEMESSIYSLSEIVKGPRGLKRRLEFIENSIPGINGSFSLTIGRNRRRLVRRVRTVERRINELQQLLSADECASNPCQNGGTCIDQFNGFLCQCPDEWEGPFCSSDVNECNRFIGTTLGCQNGATCINKPGSYICECSSNWYGLHCTQNAYDCNTMSSEDLCGKGICIKQGGNSKGFICICNPGWTKDIDSGACTIDINECEANIPHCSRDPKVDCINTPGSYRCGNCPEGYDGNGYHCADIDECLTNNGGCSITPKVQCINTWGSRVCGPCPPGFSGDGVICTPAAGGLCQINNGGCYEGATCIQRPALNYVQCICPSGWTGTGIGPLGCQPIPGWDTNPCLNNPCANGGTCTPLPNNTYGCICSAGHFGKNCNGEVKYNWCSLNGCLNGGFCITTGQTGYCICQDGYTGSKCQYRESGCFFERLGTTGVIEWPIANSTGTFLNTNCQWKIIAENESKVINITFLSVKIPDSINCSLTYLTIYDGIINNPERKLGHFCLDALPSQNIISTFRLVFVQFKSHPLASFRLNWTEIPAQCGGIISVISHGTLKYPRYGKYSNNLDCHWAFTTRYGKRIQFTFFSIMIEEHPTCDFDYLEIRDNSLALDEYGPVLGKYCNSTVPAPVVSSGRRVALHFHSDNTSSDLGFEVAYSVVEGYPGCGGIFTSSSDVIISPMEDQNNYKENLNCEWKIQLPVNEKIMIKFLEFELETGFHCTYDYLELYDGPTMDSNFVGRWCGNNIPAPFTSSSNTLLVYFRTDFTQSKGKFKISYSTVCGGLFTEPNGILTSPFYPSHYPEDRLCEYTIFQPIGSSIILMFEDFDMETHIDGECRYDYIKIFDGRDEKSQLIGTYCDTDKPPEIVSSYNYLFIQFSSDASKQSRGFKANYTTIQKGCGGIATQSSGTISYPRSQESSSFQNCSWIITANENFFIQLLWRSINIVETNECTGASIAIYDKSISPENQMGPRYCGSSLPPAMTSSSNLIYIVFHSNLSLEGQNFEVNYYTMDANKGCGANFFTTTGIIQSPNFPNNYNHDSDCKWTITVPNGQQIQLIVETFNLEKSKNCVNDYLEIRNGGYPNSPLIKRYCWNEIDKEIISLTNQLYLKFYSDAALSATGFSIKWNGAIRGCGGSLTSSSGSIISPNYPKPYGKLGECYWRISVAMGSTIQLIVVDMDLEVQSQCLLDNVKVYDGKDSKSPLLGTYCSTNQPFVIKSSSNKMFIKFRSDLSTQGRGFYLKYDTICNQTLRGFHGVIESPNFPEVDHKTCKWIITAPMGNAINITFSHFILTENPLMSYFFPNRQKTCQGVYLVIKESLNNNLNEDGTFDKISRELGRFCGEKLPPKLSSTLSEVEIILKPNINTVNNAFRLEWIISGCGGILDNKRNGEFSSPGYPRYYNHSLSCEWYITVPFGSSVEITLDELDLEQSSTCEYDSLSIYGGPDDTSPLLATLCKQLTVSQIITTSGNQAFVRFKSDESNHQRGFHARYKAVSSKCGGKFTTFSGKIYSSNYPQNYDAYDDCTFLIQIENDYRINLTFVDFDVGNSRGSNCSRSYVKVYDGGSMDAPILLTHCGNDLPPPVLSTTNKLFIRHKSDGLEVAKGFSANYVPLCGATITSDAGLLSFTEGNYIDFPHNNYYEIGNCSWIIKATDLESKIILKFKLIDLGTDERDNVLNIYAGEDETAPLISVLKGNTSPGPITVPGPVAYIKYLVSFMGSYGRFILDYSIEDTACGGTLMSENGVIESPDFPENYLPNAECVWQISASPGNQVFLNFIEFDLPSSTECDEDYVEVREQSSDGKLFGYYCGNILPSNVTASQALWVKFRSGEEQRANVKGFKAVYNLVHDIEINGTSGIIASPLYPEVYIQRGIFNWRIIVTRRKQIQIVFKKVFLPGDNDCEMGLKIFDGYDETAPLLKQMCDLELPEPISSSSNVLYLQFYSVENQKGFYFLLEWKEVAYKNTVPMIEVNEKECFTHVTLSRKNELNDTYHFTSPGYPNGYDSNLNCVWIFETDSQNHIVIEFDDIDIENLFSCSSADYINIYTHVPGKTDEWDLLYTLCDKNSSLEQYSGSNKVKVLFSTDFYSNRTGFAATASSVCGGTISSSEGILTNNGWGISPCKWYVTVSPGRTINVTFTKFEFPIPSGQTTCKRDYILLRNGGSDDSPFLGAGKYCGVIPPTVPKTTSNKLTVFIPGASIQQNLELVFREVPVHCGGNIRLTKVESSITISTPNYPNIPPPHIECVWVIIAPSDESLHFEAEKFDLTYSEGCMKEYIELRDGATEMSPFMDRFCSESTYNSYRETEGNALYIKFFTDVRDPRDGFKATVSISKCGGTIHHTFNLPGAIFSPGYPESYGGNLNCKWHLIGREGFHYSLIFDKFYLGKTITSSNNSCPTDVDTLNITDVDRTNPTEEFQTQILCGDKNPSKIMTSSNEVIITFKSLTQPIFSVQKRIFKISFNGSMQACGGLQNSPSAEIQSPGYPSSKGNKYCFWKIQVAPGRRVTFVFEDLDLEPNLRNYTHWRIQRISFYNDLSFVSRITTMFGSEPPGTTVQSSGNHMLIFYAIKHANNHRGFKGTYHSDLPAVCGGNLKGTEGIVNVSTDAISNSFYCEWIHTSSNMSWTTFTITVNGTVSFGQHSECEHTASELKVVDGSGMFSLGKICTKTPENEPFIVSSPFSSTKIIAYRMYNTNPEYIVNYTMKWKEDNCGGIKTFPFGTITSPHFPSNYPKNVDCAWLVHLREGESVKIKFESMDLPADCQDYLLIHNGGSPDSPIIGKFCGNIIPADIISQASSMWLTFHSNDENQGKGFNISFSTIENSCGGLLHGGEGILMSPNYPVHYENNAECDWELRADVGYQLRLEFSERFQIEKSPECANDFVEVFDYVDGNWKSMTKHCGRDLPKTFNSTSNRMRVLFRTNDKIIGDGFKARWYSSCGGVIQVKGPGELYSPRYPKNYIGPLNCNYTITADGKILSARFITFQLEEASSLGCVYDRVVIHATKGFSFSEIGTYCGSFIPPSFTSKNKFNVQFVADDWTNFKGFHLSYDIEVCGGNITAESIISSPLNNNRYFGNMRCIWNITAPKNNIIIIRFSKLALSISNKCEGDYILIVDTNPIGPKNNMTSGLLGKICGVWKKPPVFRTTGNTAMFSFITNRYDHSPGFEATIIFRRACEYKMELSLSTELTINPPIYDDSGKYSANMDCHWLIKAPDQYTIKVKFLSMKMANCDNSNSTYRCSCDYIEAFNGASENDEKIGRFCGQTIPGPVSTSGPFLLVKFVSDSTNQGEGFSLSLSSHISPCGKQILIVTDKPQELTSPGYPSPYPNNINCIWELVKPDWIGFQKLVYVHFNDIDIEETTSCTADRLEILEVSPPLFSGTGSNIFLRADVSWRESVFLGSRRSTSTSVFCGKKNPFDFYAYNQKVKLRFISNNAVTSKGFKLTYSIGQCKHNFTSGNGRIVRSIGPAEDCSIIISAPYPNSTISLYFSDLHIIFHEKCEIGKLEIYDGLERSDKTLLETICGHEVPNSIFSSGPALRLEYVSSSSVKSYFDMTYTTTDKGRGCGGKLFNYGGVFTSPFYPGDFRNNSVCRWDITVPKRNVPVLFFQEFNVGSRELCESDYVELYDVDTETGIETLRSTHCGSVKPAKFEGLKDTVALKYYTSQRNTGVGWLVRFMSKPVIDTTS